MEKSPAVQGASWTHARQRDVMEVMRATEFVCESSELTVLHGLDDRCRRGRRKKPWAMVRASPVDVARPARGFLIANSGLQVGLHSPSRRVWSSRREIALHGVKRLGAASCAGEDECALEGSEQHRRLLGRLRCTSATREPDGCRDDRGQNPEIDGGFGYRRPKSSPVGMVPAPPG
jgi:hypothetical protein